VTNPRQSFTLLEALITVVIVAVLLIVLIPAVRRARERASRRACQRHLAQIAKGLFHYYAPGSDSWPHLWDARDHDNPMMSLSLLYPLYVGDVSVFGCPSTRDRPKITLTQTSAGRRQSFGSVTGKAKSSYLSDVLVDLRAIGPGPGQALVADADGNAWRLADGSRPGYPSGWSRVPKRPNHTDGQNVMYFAGRVKWMETNYASDEPRDNIFCPNGGSTPDSGQWGADTDAYLWDGANPRPKELD